jgi:hypothetical protein
MSPEPHPDGVSVQKKRQCGQVALAFDNEIWAWVGFHNMEDELKIQASKLALRLGWIGLEKFREVVKLRLYPAGKVGSRFSDRFLLLCFAEFALQPLDVRLALP